MDNMMLNILDEHYNLEELRELCFKLKVSYDNLGGEGKRGKSRELIAYMRRNGRSQELIETVKEERPNLPWSELLSTSESTDTEGKSPVDSIKKGGTIVGAILVFLFVVGAISDTFGAWEAIKVVFSDLVVFGVPQVPTQTPESPPLPTATLTVTPTATPTATPVPKGGPLVEINFDVPGNGACDNYNPKILGYENEQYYIQSPETNGFIAQCAWKEVGPRGSLEVEAIPKGDLAYWGYAVIIGWHGAEGNTTDACIFGVRHTSGKEPVSEIYVNQRTDGVSTSIYKGPLDAPLDATVPHKIRLVMLSDKLAVGYIDDELVGEFQFDECKKGRIGMIGWGTGDTKVYFDNLTFNSLP